MREPDKNKETLMWAIAGLALLVLLISLRMAMWVINDIGIVSLNSG